MAASPESLASFRADFDGELISPADAAYDEARGVWNGDIDRRPAVIARCATPQQVAAAIAYARAQELEISVRGGGHNFAGLAVGDDGLTIDLSPMNAVSVDAATRRARCGGGATWAALDAAAAEHALAVTGGFISHTGIGGLTLGGGMGWLTRRAGLSIDSLVSAEVVLADGSTVRASAAEHSDLFWALRGGGGNFGVVTEFEFALHELSPMANLALLFWGVEDGVEAVRLSRDTLAGLPEEVAVLIAGLSAPPAPFVPEAYHGLPGFAFAVATFGTPEEHEALIAPVRDALPPLFEFVTPIPYVALQQMFDELNAWGRFAYEKAIYLEELSDGAIEVMVEHMPLRHSPLSFVPIFPLDGAYARVADEDTAFGGSRAARYGFNIAAVCPVAELLPPEREWVRSFWQAMLPFASNAGSYVNFMTDLEDDRVRAAYGPKYDRLAEIKARYDPENLFHRNANIRPAVALA